MTKKINIYEEFPLTRQNSQNNRKKKDGLKGPLRVVRLCVLGILLPCLLSIVILYLRYRVFVEQMYPLAMSDMRMLDSRVSTIWCQRQKIKVNATFNAFLLPGTPNLMQQTKPLSMVRHLVLEDDTKEYWGFYLLRGSTVTLSTCVRWPGASLIVIRGHKHLHECAYIGDNSSEELDEILEAIKDGTYVPVNGTIPQVEDAPSNDPEFMKRHRMEVQFHHPSHNDTGKVNPILDGLDTSDITDPKQFKELLSAIKRLKKENQNVNNKQAEDINKHVHRNSTIGQGEQGNVKFEKNAPPKLPITDSEELVAQTLQKLQQLGTKGESVLEKLNKRFKNNGVVQDVQADNPLHLRGRNYEKPPVKYDDNIDSIRRKRELIFSTAVDNLNQHDEENDLGVEEGFTPDEIADHRGTINETTLNDKSNSEFWSSFSSSEEALLNCAGLILNLPLTPHTHCTADRKEEKMHDAYIENTVTYQVPVNGYYFFVFNSENEIQPNYIRVKFNIMKTVYNVSNPLDVCANSTESCAMNLKFFSNEKVVMELPIKEDDDLWNEEFVVVSDCEPRTALYMACVISVPILVILFAFQ